MAETLDTLDRKIDTLGASVDEAFAEQRAYTEFAVERLERKMDTRFSKFTMRLTELTTEVRRLASRFDRLERKLDQFIDRHAS